MSPIAEDIKSSIENLGDTYKEAYVKTNSKLKELEERFKEREQKAGTSFLQGKQEQSLKADVFTALQENKGDLNKFLEGKSHRLQIEVKDMSLANLTGGTASLMSAPIGIAGSITRAFHVRDVLPKIPMTNGSLPVVKDNGVVGSFTPVAEGGTKPVIDFNLAELPAKAEVIAAIVNVTRQFLDDLGSQGVTNWLTSRLSELYLVAEDDQLLNGDGVSPNLSGVNTAGNFTAASSLAAANDVVQLVTSLVQMRTLQRTPQAIIINPSSLTSILLNTATGSGEFDLPGYVTVNASGGLSMMGVPLIDTVAQTAGVFTIVDTNQMLMGIRENLRIQFFEQDGSNVRTNKITIRAEARIAFATYSAAATIKGTF